MILLVHGHQRSQRLIGLATNLSDLIIPTAACRHHTRVALLDVHATTSKLFNISRPRQDGRYFPDNIFKCIFLNENEWILIKISLKFVPEGPISCSNIPALVEKMAWCRSGDNPSSEPMVVSLLTYASLGLNAYTTFNSQSHSIKNVSNCIISYFQNIRCKLTIFRMSYMNQHEI